MPALKAPVRNAFSIIKTNPAFSGVNGQIDMRSGVGTRSGQKVDETGALRVAAIWIATTTLADQVASLSQRIVRKDDLTRTPQQPEKLRALWGKPNPDQTRFGIEATETLSMVLWGYSATMLGWNMAGDLAVRWPLDPSRVSIKRSPRGGLMLCSQQGDLVNDPGERPQFEYVPLYNLPGQMEPVNPVRMAAEMAGLSMAYEETAARLMGRGMNPAAVITADSMVPEADAREITTRMEQLYGGSGNAGKVAVVGGKGVKLERMGMSMADMEFIAQYDAVFKNLLAFWKVPPTVVGMVDKPSTWGTGVAEFARGLQVFTLRPLTERRQAAHTELAQWIDPDLQHKYIFDSLLAAAPKDRAEIQSRRLQSGMTSVERILAQEDEPPFGEDETVYSPLAMATEEDRRLQRLGIQADTYASLIRAGVEPDAAAAETGFDPSQLKHTGHLPTTVQSED